MAVERPTFHESWYRVAELHPRLRTTVQISRQHFRAQPWHVVQDHTNNAFFRLAEPAYRFIGLLDGKRSVAEAWKLTNEQLGDDAPTQGEVIQLLGQLYTANLLQAEVTPDTHTLFARYKKRRAREVTSYLMNIMFARLPIFDPDAFLERWLPLFGWIFAPAGLVVWLILLVIAFYQIIQRSGWQRELSDASRNLLSPENLVLLYVAFAMIKACHEMGHAISCKKFGKQSGTGGEVHVIGIMLLIFTPVPYVDASSSWALQNKWHRAIVGAAGMWVELAIASVAAMVWAHTSDAQWIHAFAYNVMFVASFSTVVFNANPLLRYDGYYILSDLLEIPNLGQRSKDYLYYLVKKYAWNVRFARNPAYGTSEQFWLFIYCIASFMMRAVVSFGIFFYLATVLKGALIIVASIMAIAAVFTWVLMPLGKFIHYLATSSELGRVRTRAILTTLLFLATLGTIIGAIPLPDRAHAMGVVEALETRELNVGTDGGFVQSSPFLAIPLNPSLGVPRVTKGQLLVNLVNPQLENQRAQLIAERDHDRISWSIAMEKSQGQADAAADKLKGVEDQITLLDEQIDKLKFRSPISGFVIAPEIEHRRFDFMHEGERVGLVADLDTFIIRAAAGNELGGPLKTETYRRVEIHINGRPDILITGDIDKIIEGSKNLPSPALANQAGGTFAINTEDRKGTQTVENFFEVRIHNLTLEHAPREIMKQYAETHSLPLLPGQRVIVRFDMERKPLAYQIYTSLLQLFQKKFQI